MSKWRPLSKTPVWRKYLPTWLQGPAVLLFQLSLGLLLVGIGVVFFYFLKASEYDLAEVGELPRENVYFDTEGRKIDIFGRGGRPIVTRQEIPDFLVEALTAREDARFFEHCGVDFRGLARATIRNIKDRDFTQGASTLSMQLARNTFEMRAKSLHRKAVEIALTLRMERRFTKDEILTHYLNRIYFGSGAYGIEQAAEIYFGKTTSELDEGECAMIAGIIRGPHIFSPLRNFDGAIEQRNQTLDRMVDAGFISKERADEIKATEIRLNRDTEPRAFGGTSYAMKAVERELEVVIEQNEILTNGLQVHTTLNRGWQTRVESELNAAILELEKLQSWEYPIHAAFEGNGEAGYLQFAAVTTHTKTGAVLAFIGGRDFAHSRYDRTRSKRDLGSAFEPFVFAAAAERGKLVLSGKPIQTGRQIGAKEVIRLAKRCGISGPFREDEDLFRGAVAATPMEMSVGLATLGNDGKKPEAFFIRKITDREGKVLYESKVRTDAALSKTAANEAIGALNSISGTRCYIGATGSERDAWILRLGPSGSTAIWIGFDDPKKIASEARLKGLLSEVVTGLAN
jgi:penicillin-binding protein 1A